MSIERFLKFFVVSKVIGLLLIVFILFMGSPAHAGPVYMTTGNGEQKKFDLTDPATQSKFREAFGNMEKFRSCFVKADYAVSLMNARDQGTTEAEHLAAGKARYEDNKAEGNVIERHVYLDHERMVRDVHRIPRGNAEANYRYRNAYVFWDREFRWCAIP